MNRRSFLGTLAVEFAAPAVVRASSLMKIVVPTTEEVFYVAFRDSTGGFGMAPAKLEGGRIMYDPHYYDYGAGILTNWKELYPNG